MNEFIDKYGVNLIIEHNKTNIVFKTSDKNIQNYRLELYFNEDTIKKITEYLNEISKNIWSDFKPKEATSMSSDYWEYYDRKYDNNGYLSMHKRPCLVIERPDLECPYLYKFNKKRMESFIYDLNKQ